MKSFISLFFSFALLFGAPSWFYKLSVVDSNVYVGYGEAGSSQKATQQALNDISSQISTHINSSFSMQTKVKNDKVEKESDERVLQETKASFSDYKLLKSEYEDGRYFVALSYENIPSLDKFIRKVKMSEAKVTPPSGDERYNLSHTVGYLSSTFMAHKLRKAFGRDIDFLLVRKDKKWFIRYKNVMQVLDKRDFLDFFATLTDKSIDICINKKDNILYDGDRFFFKVHTKESGFVTIFDVYEDGTVAILVKNVAVKKSKIANIPDAEYESIPEAGLLKKGVETDDLYVAFFSKKRRHFDNFATADNELINEEKYKNFDELLEFLEGKKYATLKVVTKPRY